MSLLIKKYRCVLRYGHNYSTRITLAVRRNISIALRKYSKQIILIIICTVETNTDKNGFVIFQQVKEILQWTRKKAAPQRQYCVCFGDFCAVVNLSSSLVAFQRFRRWIEATPDGEGLEILCFLKTYFPCVPVGIHRKVPSVRPNLV